MVQRCIPKERDCNGDFLEYRPLNEATVPTKKRPEIIKRRL